MQKKTLFDLENLIDVMTDNVKDDIKDFNDLVNLDGCLNREIYLGDITAGVGQTVDGFGIDMMIFIIFQLMKDNLLKYILIQMEVALQIH